MVYHYSGRSWPFCFSVEFSLTYTPFISPNSQSLRTELHFQFIRFAAAVLQCASVCFHTEHRISAFWKMRFKKRSKIEQKDIITPMHCLAFPSTLFGAPFHIDNRTIADCGFWLEYASKTPLEVVADLPHRMRLFWLRCQIMRLRSVHIKPHYSQNAFDSALLAWYERGIRFGSSMHLNQYPPEGWDPRSFFFATWAALVIILQSSCSLGWLADCLRL